MSQKVEVTCDRCGKMISLYQDIKNSSAKLQLWGVGELMEAGQGLQAACGFGQCYPNRRKESD